MTGDVKPKRAYRSTLRAEQVAQTRRDIVMTAGLLFRDRGYTAVAMPVIAKEAGVGVETIYPSLREQGGLVQGGDPRGSGRRPESG